MNYTFTTSNRVIGKVINNFNIDMTDWIGRAPEWINDGLHQIKSVEVYETVKEVKPIIDYKFKLPCNLECLIKIEYNGYNLDQYQHADMRDGDDVRSKGWNKGQNRIGYELLGNGYGLSYFEDGEVTIYYKTMPTLRDNDWNMDLPLVPDNEIVIEALAHYILFCIIRKGHVHPLFNLRDNNPFTNAGMLWDIQKKKATNELLSFDIIDREAISKQIRSFLKNYNYADDVRTASSSLYRK